ncbi:MAG: hypothetical protein HYY40_02185 [Bacteroidetes bacterium]|nr:hypothetical protein [Bacteroidota bacterium]
MKNLYSTLTATLLIAHCLLPTANSFSQNYQWVNGIGGSIDDYGRSIAVDTASGAVYITGSFRNTTDFSARGGSLPTDRMALLTGIRAQERTKLTSEVIYYF